VVLHPEAGADIVQPLAFVFEVIKAGYTVLCLCEIEGKAGERPGFSFIFYLPIVENAAHDTRWSLTGVPKLYFLILLDVDGFKRETSFAFLRFLFDFDGFFLVLFLLGAGGYQSRAAR